MSVAAMLVFNYEFLPPVGNLTIADPRIGWLLPRFLVTSIMGSQLSAADPARKQNEAHSRRREIERLYKFSQKLLGEGNVIQLMNAITKLHRGELRGGVLLSYSFRRKKSSIDRGMALLISMKRK